MAEAGWFTDPHNSEQLRYWDGSTWTEHTHVPDAEVPPPPSSPGQNQPPPPTSASVSMPAPPMPAPPSNQINDIGEWIRESFKVAWKALPTSLRLIFLGILAFLPAVVVQIVALVSVGFFSDDPSAGAGTIVLFAIAGLLALAAYLWFAVGSLALDHLHYQAHCGRTTTARESLAAARRNLWRYVGAYLTVFAIGIGILLGIALVGFGLYAVIGEVVVVFAVLAYLALFPAVAWLHVKLSFLSVTAAVAPPGTRVIGTSMELSSGRFWPVLGRVLLIGILSSVAVMPLQMMLIAGFPFLASTADPVSGEPSVAGLVAFFVVFGVVIALGAILSQLFTKSSISRLYRDLGGPAAD